MVGLRFWTAVFALAAALGFWAAKPAGASAWKTYREPGFSLALPASWVDLTRQTPQVLAALRAQPNLQQLLAYARATHLIKLIAADSASAHNTGFATNANVVQASAQGTDTSTASHSAIALLRQLGQVLGQASYRSVRLPAGDSVRVNYTSRTSTGLLIAHTQYYLVHAGTLTVISYTALTATRQHDNPSFTESALSLRFS
ncbi:MAG TPA: hypothetical protein VG073_02365 [Gaiellaceae bacterium]|nr:hypothetical protein [Gaiellaceae bacterium]